jgi:hypothetical protein
MVSSFDAGIRRFRDHYCRIHRISVELEWSECVPEFGHCRTRARSVPAGHSRHVVTIATAEAQAGADQARGTWRDVNEARPHCVARSDSETKASRQAEGEAPGQAEAEAEGDAHTEAESDTDAQGQNPLHTHAAGRPPTQEPAVPAGLADHDGARRASRRGGSELLASLRLADLLTPLRPAPTNPCLRSSCGTTCGRPSHRRTGRFGH